MLLPVHAKKTPKNQTASKQQLVKRVSAARKKIPRIVLRQQSRYTASARLLMTQRAMFCGQTVILELKSEAEDLKSEREEVLIIIHYLASIISLLSTNKKISIYHVLLIMRAHSISMIFL